MTDSLSLPNRPEPTATEGRGNVNEPPEPRARARTRAEHAAQQIAGVEAGPPHPGTTRAPSPTLQVERQAQHQQQRGEAVARPAPHADAPVNETSRARARSITRAQVASVAPMQGRATLASDSLGNLKFVEQVEEDLRDRDDVQGGHQELGDEGQDQGHLRRHEPLLGRRARRSAGGRDDEETNKIQELVDDDSDLDPHGAGAEDEPMPAGATYGSGLSTGTPADDQLADNLDKNGVTDSEPRWDSGAGPHEYTGHVAGRTASAGGAAQGACGAMEAPTETGADSAMGIGSPGAYDALAALFPELADEIAISHSGPQDDLAQSEGADMEASVADVFANLSAEDLQHLGFVVKHENEKRVKGNVDARTSEWAERDGGTPAKNANDPRALITSGGVPDTGSDVGEALATRRERETSTEKTDNTGGRARLWESGRSGIGGVAPQSPEAVGGRQAACGRTHTQAACDHPFTRPIGQYETRDKSTDIHSVGMEAEGLLFNTRDKSADIHSAGAKVETRDKSTDMQSVGHLAKMETDSLQAERTNKNMENVETELMCEEKHELTEGDFGPGYEGACKRGDGQEAAGRAQFGARPLAVKFVTRTPPIGPRPEDVAQDLHTLKFGEMRGDRGRKTEFEKTEVASITLTEDFMQLSEEADRASPMTAQMDVENEGQRAPRAAAKFQGPLKHPETRRMHPGPTLDHTPSPQAHSDQVRLEAGGT